MNKKQKLELAFINWILNYKEHEWVSLTMEEKYALADFHFEKFEKEYYDSGEITEVTD